MRCICYVTANPAASLRLMIVSALQLALAALALCLSAPAQAQNAACTLENPGYAGTGLTAIFQIEINCGNVKAGRAYPVGEPLVVGLSLYSPKEVSAKRESYPDTYGTSETEAIQKENPGKKERAYVRDQHSLVYDFGLKDAVVTRETRKLVVKFEAPLSDVEKYGYMLFAVWPKKQVSKCDRKNKYARSGCARYGYVVGDVSIAATDFFPGLEITNFSHPNGEWTSERWMVEKFR